MKMTDSKGIGRRVALAFGGLAGTLARPALAQTWPSRPMRWIVPFPPGGGTDLVARTVAAGVGARLSQPIVIDNRAGASTIIGAEATARSAPDGYTMMTATSTTLVFNPGMFQRLPYNPLDDFTHVAGLAMFPHVLVVNPRLEAQNVAELVALARQRPGYLNFASPGIGSSGHLAVERFARKERLQITHVPYRGGAPAVTDVVSGSAHATFMDIGSVATQINTNLLRPLAFMQPTRVEKFSTIPTMAEAGFPGSDVYSWQGVVMPARVPSEIAARMSAEVAAVLREAELRQRFAEMGMETMVKSPTELRAFLMEETQIWVPLIRELGIRLDT
ncbi:Bug family tripartite tricarboxylate transporter substrate binding protein [Roseomonas fluvialis]|nr:tripartite tricarboxylate transporter substrate binding protein [Roseomonas fluvialis]